MNNRITFTTEDKHKRPHIVTTARLQVGDKWLEARAMNNRYLADLSFYVIESIVYLDKNTIQVNFKQHSNVVDKDKKTEEVTQEEINAYKELLMQLDLNEEKLLALVEDILTKVLLPSDLKKILREESVEFIMDEFWMYLRSGNIAYRV